MDGGVRQSNGYGGSAMEDGRSTEVKLRGDRLQTSERPKRKLRKCLRAGKEAVDAGSRDAKEADDRMAIARPQPWHPTQYGMLSELEA